MMPLLALESDETKFGFALEPAGEISVALGGMHNGSKLISYLWSLRRMRRNYGT
jgi:hypothetical protein